MHCKNWLEKIWNRKKESDIEGTQINIGFIEEEKVTEKLKGLTPASYRSQSLLVS